MVVAGFACSSMQDVADISREWLRRRRRKPGPGPLVCTAGPPDKWRDRPPGILLTAWPGIVEALPSLGRDPIMVGLFDGWVRMRRCGMDVVDAVPSDDPMVCKPVDFGYDQLRELLSGKPSPVRYERPQSSLSADLLDEIDGSATQTLLKLTKSLDTDNGRDRARDAYIGWLLFGGGTRQLRSDLGSAGVDPSTADDAVDWIKSDKGRESTRVCRRLGRRLSAGEDDIDYIGMVEGTSVAPFDLRYFAFHAKPR